jgi:hypothetical protein
MYALCTARGDEVEAVSVNATSGCACAEARVPNRNQEKVFKSAGPQFRNPKFLLRALDVEVRKDEVSTTCRSGWANVLLRTLSVGVSHYRTKPLLILRRGDERTDHRVLRVTKAKRIPVDLAQPEQKAANIRVAPNKLGDKKSN